MPVKEATPDGEAPPRAPARGRRPGTASSEPTKLTIKPIKTEILAIQIVGTNPLIVSRFSEKAENQMLAAQQGVRRQPEKRNPRREYLASLYRAGVDPATRRVIFGLPAMAFKMATIGAGRYYGKQVKMTELRQFLFFHGVSVPTEAGRMVILDGPGPRMREDYVRLAGVNHPADLRYRGCFFDWGATLYVSYTSNLLDRDSVVSLIEAGGYGVGVGEWRPERNGEFGTFRVRAGRGAVRILRELPPLYSPDTTDYDVYGDADELTLDDFAELGQPPELLPAPKRRVRKTAADADGQADAGAPAPPEPGEPEGEADEPTDEDYEDEAGGDGEPED